MRNKSIVQFRRFYDYRDLFNFLIDNRLIEFLNRENNNTLKVVYCKGIYYVTLYKSEKETE